jgi:hypothetical protein
VKWTRNRSTGRRWALQDSSRASLVKMRPGPVAGSVAVLQSRRRPLQGGKGFSAMAPYDVRGLLIAGIPWRHAMS